MKQDPTGGYVMPPMRGKVNPRSRSATNSETAQEVLTLAEAAAYLRVPEKEVLAFIHEQGLPARRVAQDYRLLKEAIRGWLRLTPKPKKGIWATIGAFKDDPHLEEIVKEAYRRRGRPITEDD